MWRTLYSLYLTCKVKYKLTKVYFQTNFPDTTLNYFMYCGLQLFSRAHISFQPMPNLEFKISVGHDDCFFRKLGDVGEYLFSCYF